MALNGNHSTSKWNTGPVDCIREMTAAILICDRTYPPAEGSHLWFDLFHVTLCVFACRRCGLHTRHAYLIASGRGSKEKEKREKVSCSSSACLLFLHIGDTYKRRNDWRPLRQTVNIRLFHFTCPDTDQAKKKTSLARFYWSSWRLGRMLLNVLI